MSEDDMCPNCVTPWKCNGPHLTGEEDMSNWSGLEDWQKADIACELLKDLVKPAEEYLATYGEYPEHLPSKDVKCLKKARGVLQVNFGFGCGME